MPYIVGLTGGIGSGKSSVAERLHKLGAGVVNCDLLGHKVYKKGQPFHELLVKEFGREILDDNQEINRKSLGNIVFGNKVCMHFVLSVVSHCSRLLSKNLKIKICKTIILPLIWGIFGSKQDENGEWRRLHNEEHHSLYRSPNIVRVIKSRSLRWVGHVARMEEGRSAFKILMGKPRVRPRCRWEDSIRLGLKEIHIISRNWVDLAQDRVYWRALVNESISHGVS